MFKMKNPMMNAGFDSLPKKIQKKIKGIDKPKMMGMKKPPMAGMKKPPMAGMKKPPLSKKKTKK